MEREEIIEELKRKVFSKIENRDAIPESVNEIVERSFTNILDLYRKFRCDNETIKEYIDGIKAEVKVEIEKDGDYRKNIQFEEFRKYYI